MGNLNISGVVKAWFTLFLVFTIVADSLEIDRSHTAIRGKNEKYFALIHK